MQWIVQQKHGLLRRNSKRVKLSKKMFVSPLTPFELTHLRMVLTGSVRTQGRLFKAGSVGAPSCVWCSQTEETVQHLFWECPAWQSLRDRFISTHASLLPNLPRCLVECGILPYYLILNGTFSDESGSRFCQDIQRLMINVLSARELKIKASATAASDPEAPGAVEQPLGETTLPTPAQDTRADLYPGYPWFHDAAFEGTAWLTGTVPDIWRVFRKGSEWSLLWYWRQLRWPAPVDSQETVSWLELAIDFHAATHCQLCSHESSGDLLTAESCARFFAAASRRLSTICGCSLVPFLGRFSQVPVLTSLGLGRCAGISVRPRLLVPHVAHRVLFLAARSHTATRTGRLRAFPLDIGTVPAPLWFCSSTRRRLTGKQPQGVADVTGQLLSSRSLTPALTGGIDIEWRSASCTIGRLFRRASTLLSPSSVANSPAAVSAIAAMLTFLSLP